MDEPRGSWLGQERSVVHDHQRHRQPLRMSWAARASRGHQDSLSFRSAGPRSRGARSATRVAFCMRLAHSIFNDSFFKGGYPVPPSRLLSGHSRALHECCWSSRQRQSFTSRTWFHATFRGRYGRRPPLPTQRCRKDSGRRCLTFLARPSLRAPSLPT